MTATVSLFIVLAATLTVLTLAIVLRPLWRDKPMPAIAAAVVLALLTFALYRLVGTPAALAPAVRQAPDTLHGAIAQLEAELQRDPRQVEGWQLLGRAYASEQQLTQARDAYARAAKLAPDTPDVLVEAAEARALAEPQHRFDVQALALLEHALQVQPQHQRARWFLGIAQRQAGKPADAAKTWEPLLAQVNPKTAASLRAQINAARSEAGLSSLPAAPAAAATTANTLRVKVQLDPQLAARARLRGDASVFVIARAPGGPPMPVAVEKHSVQELPFTASLDDADSPMPTQNLSALREVEVVARLSASGNAIPQPGDLESQPLRVRLPAKAPLVLTIDHARP
ncbi:MAG TPA: tetratricopeptide repeat protein [Luteimonas sp.]|nr:tetratricopeptide repeat protein [Luteimonas sp.]